LGDNGKMVDGRKTCDIFRRLERSGVEMDDVIEKVKGGDNLGDWHG